VAGILCSKSSGSGTGGGGDERAKKFAKRQFNTNPNFRRWFHRNFKGGPGGQGIPAGERRNPDLGDQQILEAWEEYVQMGGQ
jgi:hypothetical protein